MATDAWITAIGTGLAAVASGASVFVAWKAIKVSQKVADIQVTLNQRQMLVPLWEHLSALNHIDPKQPVVPAVLKVVNTLELVALCVEGGMVDPQMIRRTFREGFVRHYAQVMACGELAGMNGKTGSDLLRENRAAQAFHVQLMDEHIKQDQAAPLKPEKK